MVGLDHEILFTLFLGDKGDKGVIAHCLGITQWNLELSTFSSYSIDIDCQRIDIPDDIRLTYDKPVP